MSIPMTNDVLALIGKNANKIENASLMLDKFCEHKYWPNQKNDNAPINSLKRVAAILKRENNTSKELHELRRKATDNLSTLFLTKGHAKEIVARTAARLAIGLSDGIIQNGGITLDRLTGLPTIWGSAIKGVCRNAALWQIKETSDKTEKQRLLTLFWQVFGHTENDLKSVEKFLGEPPTKNISGDAAGMIYFMPAYPLDSAFLEVDITNVHTPDYYRSGKTADLKKERPSLTYFPTVAKGALFSFLITLSPRGANNQHANELLSYAEQTLKTALTIQGLGAKTGAGYGWFTINDELTTAREKERTNAASEKVAAAERSETEPDTKLYEEFKSLTEQTSRALVNPFQFDKRTWKKEGKEADEIYRLSIFKYFTEENTALYQTEKIKKKSKFINALSNLANHFSQDLP